MLTVPLSIIHVGSVFVLSGLMPDQRRAHVARSLLAYPRVPFLLIPGRAMFAMMRNRFLGS